MKSMEKIKNKIIKIAIVVIVAIILCLGALKPAIAQEYYVFNLGTLDGTNFSIAYGINDLGQVTGISGKTAFLWDPITGMNPLEGSNSIGLDINNSSQVVGREGGQAALWEEDGSLIIIGDLGSGYADATAINNEGVVVGYSPVISGSSHAWLWDPDTGITDIDTTGYSNAFDINDNEIVVGRFGSPAHYPAFWQDGVMTPIGTSTGQAQGINNQNQIVGAHDGHAFLWEDSSMTDLGTIGTAHSDAKAINENDQVVGQLTFQGGVEHAMFWQDGEMYDLNDLINPDSSFILTNAFDINDSGQIVGVGTFDGEKYAFLLNPVPIPSTVWLLGSGLIGIVGIRRKFKK